jgi:hypothetical protein
MMESPSTLRMARIRLQVLLRTRSVNLLFFFPSM